MPPRSLVVALALAATAAGAAGCGGSGSASACAPAHRDPVDPASAQHLFPGAAEPTYVVDPPTSGPHLLGDHAKGALRDPIPRPVQVAMLEVGEILVQYRPSIGAKAIAKIDQLAGGNVSTAPNPGLPAPVVGTAWTFTVTCQGADLSGLRAFIRLRAGHSANNP